jgi:hypothetical protein
MYHRTWQLSACKPEATAVQTQPAVRRSLSKLFAALALTTAVFCSARSAQAVDYTWNNLAGGNWNTPTNWTPNGVPDDASDNAFITTDGTYTVTVNGTFNIGALTLGAVGAGVETLSIGGSGNRLTLNSASTVRNNAQLLISGSGTKFDTNANLLIQQTAIYTQSAGVVNLNSTVDVNNNSDFNLTGGTLNLGSTFTVRNTFDHSNGTLQGAGSVVLSSNATNIGTYNLSGGTVLLSGNITSDGAINWTGGAMRGTGSIINNATNAFTTPTIAISGASTKDSRRNISNSGNITWTGGNITSTGSNVTNNAAGVITSNTDSDYNGTGSIVNDGTFTKTTAGVTDVDVPFTLNTGGTLSGVGTLRANNTFTWTGGTMSGAGTTTISSSSTLGISGATVKTLTNRTLTIQGTANWAGTGAISATAATITNSGTFNTPDDGDITGTATFSNAGVLNVGGVGATGTLDVSGSVSFSSGSIFNVEAAGDTDIDQLNVTGAPGTVAVAGTLNVLSLGGYTPAITKVNPIGPTFTVVTGTGGRSGVFATVNNVFNTTTCDGVRQNVNYTANAVSLVTVSTRPVVTSISPTFGTGGTVVTLTGSGFTGATVVEFNQRNSPAFTVDSDTQITATAPAGGQTGAVTVTNCEGESLTGPTFRYAPHVGAFSPSSGPVGTTVTINGKNFTAASNVFFAALGGGNIAASNFVFISSNQVQVDVPVGATTGPVTLTNEFNESSTSAAAFRVSPRITSFTPDNGPVGTVVTITGNNFTGATEVRFNGVRATTFTVDSDTQITVTVPNGATDGNISVKTPSGTGVSITPFDVTPSI